MQEFDAKSILASLEYESREAYDRAKKEADFIGKVSESLDVAEPKTALKLYNKIVTEKSLSSVVGYEYLNYLREIIIEAGLGNEENLAHIPVREVTKTDKDTIEVNNFETERYKKLYEGQKVINKKIKIVLIACIIVLVGFVVVNFRLEYSIFTYFTNYKANMEEELIDKYQYWAEQLEKKEQELNSGSDTSE